MGRCLTVTLAAALAAGACDVHAQNWPTRQIEMIIPFAAGSGVDLIGRAVGGAIGEQVGQNVIVVNRDGASGSIGFNALASAAPDGYTIGAGPTTPITNAPYLLKGIRYSVDSFEYVCQVFDNIFAIAVAKEGRFNSIQDLLALARANPGKVTYAHSGVGTIPHLSVENAADALGLKLQHVPFRSEAQWLPALLRGDLDFASTALTSARSGEVRLLAVFLDERHPDWPDVPTAKELGVATSVPPGYNGVYAPKGIPPTVLSALEKGCAAAVKGNAVLEAVYKAGMTVHYLNSAQFHARTASDHRFKGELIRRLGLAAQ